MKSDTMEEGRPIDFVKNVVNAANLMGGGFYCLPILENLSRNLLESC